MPEWFDVDGDAVRPIPEGWIKHGEDDGTGRPRLYAVSVLHRGRGQIIVRYLHPTEEAILHVSMEADQREGGLVPSLLNNPDGSWPRSVVPTPSVEPSDVAREVEIEHLRELWGGRVEDIPPPAEPIAVAGGERA